MNCYYIMLHFGRGVTGYLVPEAKDEEDARKKLLKSLIDEKHRIIKANKEGTFSEYKSFNQELRCIQLRIKSLVKHWRITDNDFKVCIIHKLTDVAATTFWLEYVKDNGQYICNLYTQNEPK